MASNERKQGYYILPWALSAAFLIRAMILRDRPETYAEEGVSIWQSPAFYFFLSAAGFIIGLYLLMVSKKD